LATTHKTHPLSPPSGNPRGTLIDGAADKFEVTLSVAWRWDAIRWDRATYLRTLLGDFVVAPALLLPPLCF